MKKLLALLITIITLLLLPPTTNAIENPLAVPNNKMGIHILFVDELPEAAKLINSNGGDWGYVTIPIQIGDRDLVKWQQFMDEAKKYHVTPIIRLASEGDYFNTRVWKKPSYEDVVDFANFLDSLQWPVKNRYVIVFNETNRGDEWGGEVNPAEYAQILSFAVTIFKSKNPDYFIISSGMDNAAPQAPPDYMNQYSYFLAMNDAVPGIFNQIDGFASHSYPNPGFSQPPSIATMRSISSFIYERNLVRTLRNTDIPIFITETGWNAPHLSDDTKATYYQEALGTVWNDPGIVTITPFLFKAGDGPFKGFSFLNTDGSQTPQYKTFASLPKIKGNPLINRYRVLPIKKTDTPVPLRDFSKVLGTQTTISLSQTAQTAFKWMMKL